MTYKNPGHEQTVLSLDQRPVQVDKGMATLLFELWENHIDTIESCQGTDSEPAYLCFPSRADASIFLRTVFHNSGTSYWDDLVPGIAFVPKEGWVVKTYAEVDGEAVEADEVEAGGQVIVMVDFPISEIPRLERMF